MNSKKIKDFQVVNKNGNITIFALDYDDRLWFNKAMGSGKWYRVQFNEFFSPDEQIKTVTGKVYTKFMGDKIEGN